MRVRDRLLSIAIILFITASASAEPRPLDTGWELLLDPAAQFQSARLPGDGWRPVQVGVPWNAQFADLRDYMGVAWYRVRFDGPAGTEPRRVIVRFGAVDHEAAVFVNGRRVGSHEGAYTPFSFDITSHVKPGANDLLVRVTDPPPTPRGQSPRFPAMPYEEIPRGKQSWYIQNGGIWQPVSLDVRPALYLESVRITPRTSGEFTVDAELAGAALPRDANLTIAIRDASGKTVVTLPRLTAREPGKLRATGKVPQPRLWSPATPALYTIEASLSGPVADVARDRFGFREFAARDGKFFLNGEPFYMIAALDQDFYPETLASTPGRAYLVDMMQKGRKLGLNLLRCHIKVCDPDYLAAADETGMLVWYEVPSWETWTDAAVARGRRTFEAMTLRDWNRPSIVIQSLINEAWGIDMTKAEQRAGLLSWFADARKLVEPLGRLVVDNSACCQNFHMQTDIDDFHQYFSIPDNADRWDEWVADLASRPDWTFSPHGDARRTRNEPLVLSEFGNWGLPELPSELPWWFPRDFDGREITRPAGLFDRFHALGFDRVFRDYPTLAGETQWRQFFSLKHEIESIRRHSSIQGYVITEFTDINWEANGLMDMWRRPKLYAEALAHIQQDDVLLPSSAKRVLLSGETEEVVVQLSRFSAQDPAGATLRWSTTTPAGQGFDAAEGAAEAAGTSAAASTVARGAVGEIARVRVTAARVERPTRQRVTFQLVAPDGRVLARNTHDLYVYPKPVAPAASITLHDPHGALTHLPFRPAGPPGAGTIVASVFDAQVREHVEAGGTALVALTRVLFPMPEAYGLTLVDRRGDMDGNWVSNFPWMHVESPAFRGVGLSRVTGFEARAATPRVLIAGVPASAWSAGDVLAGMFFGWINENHATTVQFRVGKGKVVFTTFDTTAYGTDPFTTHLVNGLVSYVGSDACAPGSVLP